MRYIGVNGTLYWSSSSSSINSGKGTCQKSNAIASPLCASEMSCFIAARSALLSALPCGSTTNVASSAATATSEPNNVEGDLGGTCPSLVSSTTSGGRAVAVSTSACPEVPLLTSARKPSTASLSVNMPGSASGVPLISAHKVSISMSEVSRLTKPKPSFVSGGCQASAKRRITSREDTRGGKVGWPRRVRTRRLHSSARTSSHTQQSSWRCKPNSWIASWTHGDLCAMLKLHRSITTFPASPSLNAERAAFMHASRDVSVSWFTIVHPSSARNRAAKVLLPDPGRPHRTSNRRGAACAASSYGMKGAADALNELMPPPAALSASSRKSSPACCSTIHCIHCVQVLETSIASFSAWRLWLPSFSDLSSRSGKAKYKTAIRSAATAAKSTSPAIDRSSRPWGWIHTQQECRSAHRMHSRAR
mmetsp:Transcript_40176/g.90147  ORF Transcript_40176/g.90147 Transcript_40176/m.90147 type:complete len:420 (+) Transcript_40176:20-1279(+)